MTYFEFDNDVRKHGHLYLVGVDEAGRGPLAGPVFATAVILPPFFNDERIKDSKQLTAAELLELSDVIKEQALDYKIVHVDAPVIDQVNIYQATILAMQRAIEGLKHEFHFVLTDAMPLSNLEVGYEAIIHGDETSLSVAAASILAKVARDAYMDKLAKLYPQYDFENNKGYPTRKHLQALDTYGPIKDVHRYSYKPVQDALNKQIKLF